MVWISNFFFCMGSTAVAGSVMVVMLLCLQQFPRWKDSRLMLSWVKMAQTLFCLPVGFGLVMVSRAGMGQNGVLWISDFGTCTTPAVTKWFGFLGSIWLVGLTVGVLRRIGQFRKLWLVLQGNVPVDDPVWQRQIGLHLAKYDGYQVQVYQNDLLQTPITVGMRHPQIILPFEEYTQKELSMILEHELNHVQRHDLFWRKIGLFVTWLHWWNPLAYTLLNMLSLRQEIECDIQTCEDTELFTMREYGLFLAQINTEEEDAVFSSALRGTKKNLFRRVEGMVNSKSAKKAKRITVVISCLAMCMVSVTPAYAATEVAAQVQEEWLKDTAAATEVESVEETALEVRTEMAEDTNVTEIDLTQNNTNMLITAIGLEYTIKPGIRVLYRFQNMDAGEKLTITALCDDESITYRIGIKNSNTGAMTYLQGTGVLSYTFTIETAGRYTAYVENMSSVAMDVTGHAYYPD